MKYLFFFFMLMAFNSQAQQSDSTYRKADPSKKKQLVEVSCGECQFKMKGKGCNLAIRIDGKKTYWVDGPTIDSFGDAHADDGFCNAIRKAEVQGKVTKGNRFLLTFLQFVRRSE